MVRRARDPRRASSTTRGPTARPAIRSTTARRYRGRRLGLRRDPARHRAHRLRARGRADLDGQPRATAAPSSAAGWSRRPSRARLLEPMLAGAAPRAVVVPRAAGDRVRRQHPLHEGRPHADELRVAVAARPARRQAPGAGRAGAPASRPATARSPTSPAAPAPPRRVHEVRQVPRGLPGERDGAAALASGRDPRAARAGQPGGGRPASAACSAPLLAPAADGGGYAARSSADGVRAETAWSCMQCNACVEICPVGIEQAPIINQLRRRLVEEGEIDPTLQSTLQTIHKSGNSFGENRRKRGRWTQRARLRGQGRAQGAGRGALVRRRLRLVRPALAARVSGARAPVPGRRGRLRDPLRR